MKENFTKTYVVGHRNPDTDSVAAAYAVAELKKAMGEKNVSAGIAGLPGPRTEYLFKKFNVPMPQTLNDVFPRVRDIMNRNCPVVNYGEPLFDAIEVLQKNHVSRLPIVDNKRNYKGMICLFSLLGDMLQLGNDKSESSLTGRKVRSSLGLIIKVIAGEALSLSGADLIQDFEVYVAAMNIESFKDHIPRTNPETLAIVVGDRTDIHLMAINIKARLMIITGARKVDEVVLQAAKERGISIIKTPFDSASVVRRLKFSCPVELSARLDTGKYRQDERLSDIRNKIFNESDDVFPVLNKENRLLGTFCKNDFDNSAAANLILVDHNEFDQSISGVEEIPVIEVIDHHRLGMPPTHTPIKITCDAVGSTCTLVTEMYIQNRINIPKSTAAILLGGIIMDTLLLHSPTTTARDRLALDFLTGAARVNPEKLMQEIFKVGSLIARSTPKEVLEADRKNFQHLERYHFSISQVEEVSFDEFYLQEANLSAQAEEIRIREKLDFFGLLITNVVQENSLLLAVASPTILEKLPFRRLNENLFDLPGVLSRKKQVLPQILKVFDSLN